MCVRPQTYENEAEVDVLSYVFAGRSGLENTSFALLDSEGKKLTRGSRSPQMTYRSSDRFAQALVRTSADFIEEAKPITELPVLRDLRLALNVAAADMRPLVIVRGKDAKQAAKLAELVSKFAWDDETVGLCHYVVLSEEVEFEGLKPELGVSIVQPDPYGLGGKVLEHAGSGASASTLPRLTRALLEGLSKHEVSKRIHAEHVREARRRGIEWKTEVPVTDTHAGDEKRGRRGGRR